MPLHLFKTLIRGYLFWPLVMVALAMVLAAIAANGDDHLAGQDEIADALNVLRLSNDDARAVLSTVASAAITVLSLVYSMTLVVFTLAASALGNRIIRTFGDNRLGQITAGLLAGTFIFALATLYRPTRPAAADLDRRGCRFGDRVGHPVDRLRQQCFPPHPDRQ